MSYLYYEVNNRKFSNQFLAHYEAFKSGTPVRFNCNDQLYDAYNWENDPEESFETLMDLHAFRLRDKYRYLILNWSGGTDSHTIYNVFKRNNIHIDEICVKYSLADSEFFPKGNADWLVANHWDRSTKITLTHDQDPEQRSIVLPNEDWIFNDVGDFRRYGSAGVDIGNLSVLRNIHGADDWAVIAGFEKPKVYERDGKWYAAMPDFSIRAALGHSNLECFFLEPKIHMKQCHLLKNFIKAHPSTSTVNKYTYDYYVEARATGRHDELVLGVSLGQKEKNRKNQKDTLIDLDVDLQEFSTHDVYLTEKLKNNDPTAMTYVRGLYNLRYETEFWDYLNRNCFTHPNAIWSMKPVWSKSYFIGL